MGWCRRRYFRLLVNSNPDDGPSGFNLALRLDQMPWKAKPQATISGLALHLDAWT